MLGVSVIVSFFLQFQFPFPVLRDSFLVRARARACVCVRVLFYYSSFRDEFLFIEFANVRVLDEMSMKKKKKSLINGRN